jgi:hypothetical protein
MLTHQITTCLIKLVETTRKQISLRTHINASTFKSGDRVRSCLFLCFKSVFEKN